jgi:hypothetical protein
MKVLTQFGMLEINPADVVSIRPAPVLPDNMDYCDLTYYIEFDDRFYSLEDHAVCISESDAEKLAELSGVEILRRNITKTKSEKPVFVSFKKLLVLNEWEKHFDGKMAWKKGVKSEPESKPAPSSFSPDDRTLYEENHQPINVIDQVFRDQNNCTKCGKLVYNESRICTTCIGKI